MYSLLRETALLHLDIHQAYVPKTFSPRFWGSCSIAELLNEASLGFPSHPKLKAAGQAALDAFNGAKTGLPRFPKGVQSIMYSAIVRTMYPDSIPALISRRMRVLGISREIHAALDFHCLREKITKFSAYIVFTLLRSWANAWTTSHRMHEHFKRDCLLGCNDADDDFLHYLGCPRMWRALKTALLRASLPVPTSLISAQFAHKLALINPTREEVLHICSITYTYHIIKNIHRSSFHAHCRNGNLQAVADVTIDVMTAAVRRFAALV